MSEVIRAVCPHDCPDTCLMLVTVEDGRAVRIAGDPDHPMTQGFLCTKVSKYLERTYHPDRLAYPQIRVGAKGEGRFRRATWDEATSLIAERLHAIIASADGSQAILPYSYAGTMGLVQGEGMASRFFRRIGASFLDRTICSNAGGEAFALTYGAKIGTDPEAVPEARLVLLWGTNTLTSNPHLWPFIRRARDNGARVICIDPLRTRTAAASDEHIAIRPGTDAALALAMMHVLFRDGLEDRQYLDEMTLGWQKLRDRVLADYSPERVAKICRLPIETIERLGTLYGTTRPTFIRLNYGLQRHAGGGSAVRAISLLPAITGAWNDAGGGCQLSSSGTFEMNTAAMERTDLGNHSARTINMTRLGEALTETNDPPVKALIIHNSNPGSIAPDRETVLRGLRRDDLFTVVLEHFQTDTADYADVLLPATTQLEHDDLHKAYGHLYATYNKRSIEPLGEALPNSEIFRRIAAAMHLDYPELRESDEELMRAALTGTGEIMNGVTFEALREHGSVRLNVPSPHLPFRRGAKVPTPSGRIEIESQQVADLGLDPLPVYIAPYESEERAPELARRFPLALISPPAHEFLNSSFVNVASLRRSAGKPTLEIHADDAQARSIADGARVKIFNDRGTFTADAVVTDRVRPGVVSAQSVWWGRLTSDGANANQTTSQALTDIGRGATFYDNLVEVKPV
ncbi:MAG TPA: molybdopterin oxidoreductase family protein [Thermoanaerobaculia bacterium]|jgi:anaerobic selenocysteine-containing dehydrogenase|nr:molybdopterin oxidoreductase family protein [Thermoanaerobaculia bacterium]